MMRVTHKAAAAGSKSVDEHSIPISSSSGSKRIPDWFSQQSTSPLAAAAKILAGTGTINDVFALVVREDSSDEMSHLSSVVMMLRCLTAYHSVLSVRYETEVGLYPAGYMCKYNSWMDSVLFRVQNGYTLHEVLDFISPHLRHSLLNVKHDFHGILDPVSHDVSCKSSMQSPNLEKSMDVDDEGDIPSPPRQSLIALTPTTKVSTPTSFDSTLSTNPLSHVASFVIPRRPWLKAPPSAPHSPYMTLDTPMKIHGSIAVRSPLAASGSSYPGLSKQIPTKHQKSMRFADTDNSETSFIVSRERPASIMLPHATTSSLPSSKSQLDIPFTRSGPVTTILKTQSLNETKRAVEKSWGKDTYGSNQYAKNSNSYSQAPTAQYYTQRKDQFGRDTRENTSAWRVKTSDQRSRRDQENWNYQRRREFNQQPSGKEQTSWKNGGGSYNYRPDHVEPVSSVASQSTNDPKPTYASIVSKGQSEGVQQVAVKPVQAWRRGESRPTPYSSNINSNARTSWRDRKENVEPQGQWRKDRNWRSNNK